MEQIFLRAAEQNYFLFKIRMIKINTNSVFVHCSDIVRFVLWMRNVEEACQYKVLTVSGIFHISQVIVDTISERPWFKF